MSDDSALIPRDELDAVWQRGFKWVEDQLGGRLVSWNSQLRWRPAWFLELEREGERLSLYWRGARPEFHNNTDPLKREMQIFEVLRRNGIPVPKVYGLCEDPPGLLMECSPGRFNLATEPDLQKRAATLEHYIEILSSIHMIDVKEFEAIGFHVPRSPERSCLGDLPPFERMYRANKNRPDPIVEFQLGWLKRNVPKGRAKTSFLVCDSGQFLFEDGRVTAVLDLELAYIGDPAADLAGLRTRDLSEPLGDLGPALQRYGELTGAPVDPAAVDYHTIRFSLVNPLSVAHLCAEPLDSTNYVQYLSWYVVYTRCAFEVQARRLGIELDPPKLPDARPSRRGAAHRHLTRALAQAREAEVGDRHYELDRMQRVAHALERSDAYGAELAEGDLADAAELLGHRPASWEAADAELEALVLASGPERDAEFIRAFHRRMVRDEFLLAGVLREIEDSVIPPID